MLKQEVVDLAQERESTYHRKVQKTIKDEIPEDVSKELFTKYETELLDVVVEEWEHEFDAMNPFPEENSDFDSDNEINPMDTLTTSAEGIIIQGMQTDNSMKKKPIQMSIVGRPNVGKSTLVNALLEEERVIANDLPGTTRDSVMIQWIHHGRRVNLVDTAGFNHSKGVVKSKMDEMILEQVTQAIKYSHIVVVIIDSMESFTKSDMMVISKVLEEGRGLVIAANKWDLVDDRYKQRAVKWMSK